MLEIGRGVCLVWRRPQEPHYNPGQDRAQQETETDQPQRSGRGQRRRLLGWWQSIGGVSAFMSDPIENSALIGGGLNPFERILPEDEQRLVVVQRVEEAGADVAQITFQR